MLKYVNRLSSVKMGNKTPRNFMNYLKEYEKQELIF